MTNISRIAAIDNRCRVCTAEEYRDMLRGSRSTGGVAPECGQHPFHCGVLSYEDQLAFEIAQDPRGDMARMQRYIC